MAPKIGQTASAAEVKARWAYAEMRSSRFRRHFAAAGYTDLLEKTAAGIPFCRLSGEEQKQLATALHAAKTEVYISSVDHSAETYECNGWTEHDLMEAWALPLFNFPDQRECIPYRDFYQVGVDAAAGIHLGEGDPRVAARSVPVAGPYEQAEAVIVIGHPGEYLLLEGYLRSLLFMKSPDKSKRLLTWLPVPRY